ncbi:CRISPR associated protein Cas6 [compost metagenome]
MRLSVTYEVNRIPVAYRLTILSLLKEALRRADPAYYEHLYVQNAGKMKPFSTAVYLKDFTYVQDEIHLKSITINISSADMSFMIHIFNGLQHLPTYETAGATWTRSNIQMNKEAEIHSDEVQFSTLSPILIENKAGKPLHPDQEEYATEFSYYAALRIKELTGRDPYRTVQIEPLSLKKIIIRESNREFRNQENPKKYLYFTAYRGHLKLKGHPADLQLLYQSGVGKRVSQSFGLLEYVREG